MPLMGGLSALEDSLCSKHLVFSSAQASDCHYSIGKDLDYPSPLVRLSFTFITHLILVV